MQLVEEVLSEDLRTLYNFAKMSPPASVSGMYRLINTHGGLISHMSRGCNGVFKLYCKSLKLIWIGEVDEKNFNCGR